jgi:non-specific serine/threonine protein kinase
MVTLTGFGGMGKSRLALHVAYELRRAFPDGAHLVELASVQDPSLVPQAVAAALRLDDRSVRDPETVLVDYLAHKHLLLLLDNCEHLLDVCGRLTSTLLAAAPRLRILATSREPLGIGGERVWPVPPLSVPAMSESDSAGPQLEAPSEQREALVLFEHRAAAVRPGFTLNKDNEDAVASLCSRLDGVPLAIELAAVRVRMLSVEEILTRLEDRFQLLSGSHRANAPRHQTLRAAVDWSFELCTEREQWLWARCSVFSGEFDLDAAESVCSGDGMSTEDVFVGTAELIDKSILARVGHGSQSRYRMLETIRQYGQEQLARAGTEAAQRRRHRDYYLHLAERSDAESAGPHQADWIERLRAERPNFLTALDYCLSTPSEAKTGLRMTTALWFYWAACGFVREGRTWLDRALALNTEASSERARALWINGWVAHLHGDRLGSLTSLRQSRALCQQLGDETELTYATQFLGDTEMWDNNFTRAVPLLDEALARHRASDHWTAPALLIFALEAQTAGLLDDVDRAMGFLHECQTLCTPRGERWALSWAEWNIGVTWWAAGDPEKAGSHLSESLRKKRALNDLLGHACCVELLAWVVGSTGDQYRAALLFGGLEKMWERVGTPLFGSETLLSWSRQARARAREALTTAEFEEVRAQGTRMSQEEIVAHALGEKFAASSASAEASASAAGATLTKRQYEVAALLATGKSNKEIAAELVISLRTAETHVEHILVKLGFTSRTQVATWIAQHQQG